MVGVGVGGVGVIFGVGSTRVPGPVAIVSLETRKVNAVRVPPQNGVGDHHQTIVCVYGPTAMSVPTVPPKRGRKGGNA